MGLSRLRLKIVALCLLLVSSARWAWSKGLSYDASPRHIRPVSIPGGTKGIGFDDMNFSPSLKQMLVPGGRMGDLFLVDPQTHDVSEIGGFSVHLKYHGGHDEGVTSADSNKSFIFATDRTSMKLNLIDSKSRKIIASAPLAGEPDYVRYVASHNELWVTEPRKNQIEVFSFNPREEPPLRHLKFISIAQGPESLVIDEKNRHAFTNSTSSETAVIDLKSKKILAHWPNHCARARGLALDLKNQFLFVGCAEGKVETLDAAHGGKVLGTARSGRGVDIIAYNPLLSHLYMPGSKSGTMAIVHVLRSGKLHVDATMPTAQGAHCVASDDKNGVWICDPHKGRLLFFQDSRVRVK